MTPMITDSGQSQLPPKCSAWQKVKQAFKEAMTGKDNHTHDMGKWSWLICTLSLLAHDAWQLSHGVQTNVKDFAFALSAIAAAHGAALKLKERTEPEADEKGGNQ